VDPQVGLETPFVQEIASLGFWSLSVENMGTSTYSGSAGKAGFLFCPGGLMVGGVPTWQIGTGISPGCLAAGMPLKFRSLAGWSLQSKSCL
jgi:hypothetical protein